MISVTNELYQFLKLNTFDTIVISYEDLKDQKTQQNMYDFNLGLNRSFKFPSSINNKLIVMVASKNQNFIKKLYREIK